MFDFTDESPERPKYNPEHTGASSAPGVEWTRPSEPLRYTHDPFRDVPPAAPPSSEQVPHVPHSRTGDHDALTTEDKPGTDLEPYRLPPDDVVIPEDDAEIVIELDPTRPNNNLAYYRNETTKSGLADAKDDKNQLAPEGPETTEPQAADDDTPSKSTELELYQPRTMVHELRDKEGRLITTRPLGPGEQPPELSERPEYTAAVERWKAAIAENRKLRPETDAAQPETTDGLARIREEVTDLALPGSETNIEEPTAPQGSTDTPPPPDGQSETTTPDPAPDATEPSPEVKKPKEKPDTPTITEETDPSQENAEARSTVLEGQVLGKDHPRYEDPKYNDGTQVYEATDSADPDHETRSRTHRASTHFGRSMPYDQYLRGKTWDDQGNPRDVPNHGSRRFEASDTPRHNEAPHAREHDSRDETYVARLREYAAKLDDGNADNPPSVVDKTIHAAGSVVAGAAKIGSTEVASTFGVLPRALLGNLKVTEVVQINKGLRGKLFPKFRVKIVHGNRSTYRVVGARTAEEAAGKFSGPKRKFIPRYKAARDLS